MTIHKAGHRIIDPPRLGVGDRLRRFRITTGMTLIEFAEGTGYSAGTLGKVEHNNPDPEAATTQRLAAILQLARGIPARWLLYGSTGTHVTDEYRAHGYRSSVVRLPAPRRLAVAA